MLTYELPRCLLLLRVLTVVSVLAAVVGFSVGSACADDPVSDNVVLMGPIPLGELFVNMRDGKAFADNLVNGSSLTFQQIADSLNGCQVYLIDRKQPLKSRGSWVFADVRPVALLSGKLSFGPKDKTDRNFHISLREVSIASVSSTQNNGGIVSRSVSFNVFLKTDEYRIFLKGGIGMSAHEFTFPTRELTWDLGCRPTWPEKR
jgi:hypothetical protein